MRFDSRHPQRPGIGKLNQPFFPSSHADPLVARILTAPTGVYGRRNILNSAQIGGALEWASLTQCCRSPRPTVPKWRSALLTPTQLSPARISI